MKKLGTAPSYLWLCAWLYDQNEKKEDWQYISSVRHLYRYRDVEIHVVIGYPSGFAHPYGWEWASAQMKEQNITEVREM